MQTNVLKTQKESFERNKPIDRQFQQALNTVQLQKEKVLKETEAQTAFDNPIACIKGFQTTTRIDFDFENRWITFFSFFRGKDNVYSAKPPALKHRPLQRNKH